MKIDALLKEAEQVYHQNFSNTCWYGRCIFLSWYCSLGTCKFCFRSTVHHKVRFADRAERTVSSLLVEALLCKKLGWRIEFLTGGCKTFPIEDLVERAKLIGQVYGEKIWLNLGALSPSELEQFRPYVKGLVSSIETVEPKLHDFVCPDKPIAPYEQMFDAATGFKRSITIVIGLGEKKKDFELLAQFISKYRLDRITFYALKPVKGTPFKSGPKTEDYLWWIAQTRIRFPKLEIIAGTTARRYEEVGLLLQAGANAFTKFPATKMFGTPEAYAIEKQIKDVGREFRGTITKIPKEIDWNKEIEQLPVPPALKAEIRLSLTEYLKRMEPK